MTDDTSKTEAPTQEIPETPDGANQTLAERRDAQIAQTADQGVLHDAGLLDQDADGYIGAPTVQEAAQKPTKGDTGFIAPEGTVTADAPATMKDQKKPRLEGKEYQQGYSGDVTSTEDLTLPAVLKRDYPDATASEN